MLNSLVIRIAAGGTMAVGVGLFAVQSGWIGGPATAQASDPVVEEQTLVSASQPEGTVTPVLPEIEETNVIIPHAEQSLAPAATVVPASFDDPLTTPLAPSVAPLADSAGLSPLGLPCDITVSATAMPAAMVALDVMAPCRTNAAVAINHSGLQVIATTDALGLLTLDIPAFETPAFFSVEFSDGVEETVLVGLPDLRDFDRIGLSWHGDMGLELHAMEFGAAFGDLGHVWQEAPAGPETAVSGEGGFLTTVETGNSFAQVYTLPRATLREGDSVRLSIDAPVTQANCTRNVSARTLRAEGGDPVEVTELTFTVPACDAVGDVLVLQNLLDDLRLASN